MTALLIKETNKQQEQQQIHHFKRIKFIHNEIKQKNTLGSCHFYSLSNHALLI